MLQSYFEELNGEVLINKDVYQLIEKEFYPLFLKDQEFMNFINSDDAHQTKKEAFLGMMFSIFVHDNVSLMKQMFSF